MGTYTRGGEPLPSRSRRRPLAVAPGCPGRKLKPQLAKATQVAVEDHGKSQRLVFTDEDDHTVATLRGRGADPAPVLARYCPSVTSLVLASASPARLATLKAAGIEPSVVVSGVDESQVIGLAPAELAQRLAQLKCAAVATEVSGDRLVLGCDSVLELDGEALGKPADAAEAVNAGARCAGAVRRPAHRTLPA